jgi:hypothetical protein
MDQAVGRRTPNAEVCFRYQISVCGIVVDCDTVTGFSTSSSVFPCHYYLNATLYSCIIWGMNNRPVGDSSSETLSHPIDMNKKKKEISIYANVKCIAEMLQWWIVNDVELLKV